MSVDGHATITNARSECTDSPENGNDTVIPGNINLQYFHRGGISTVDPSDAQSVLPYISYCRVIAHIDKKPTLYSYRTNTIAKLKASSLKSIAPTKLHGKALF